MGEGVCKAYSKLTSVIAWKTVSIILLEVAVDKSCASVTVLTRSPVENLILFFLFFFFSSDGGIVDREGGVDQNDCVVVLLLLLLLLIIWWWW